MFVGSLEFFFIFWGDTLTSNDIPYGVMLDHGYVPLVVKTSQSFSHSRLITGFVTRLTRRVPLAEQELLTLPEHMRSPPDFQWGSCYSIFSFICMFCGSLFVLLYFFFWPLCCMFFFDIRILIAPLVSSNNSQITFHPSLIYNYMQGT